MRDTRADILLEAEALIRARGYSGVSYADLAAVVGIRKASIHHHFPTKGDLALGLLRAYDARYDAGLADIMAKSSDGRVRLRAYAYFYRQGVEKGLGCLCAAFAAELETLPEALRGELARFLKKHTSWIEQVLAEGRRNGTVREAVEPRSYARMIVAALEGALMMERTLDGPVGFDDAFRAIDDAIRPAG
jgi:TetR/AcrR family transcriptional regulator, transcriptional repressor for nem operon